MSPQRSLAEAWKRGRTGSARGVTAAVVVGLTTLSLTGCESLFPTTATTTQPPAGSLDAQAQTWAAAINASDPAIGTSEPLLSDLVAGAEQRVIYSVVLRPDEALTKDVLKNVYYAVMDSTAEEWKNVRLYVDFAPADDKYSPVSISDACAALGIQGLIQGSVYCSDGNNFGIVPNADLGGIPGTPNALGSPDSYLSQQQAWTDAATASSPDVAFVATNFPNYDPDLVYVNVTLRSGATLTYDTIEDVFDALQASTTGTGNGIWARVFFFADGDPDNALLLAEAFAAAGVVNPNTDEPYEDDTDHITRVLALDRKVGN